MYYLSSDQVNKYILLNFSYFDLFCLFDLSNFQKPQMLSIQDIGDYQAKVTIMLILTVYISIGYLQFIKNRNENKVQLMKQ